MRLARCMRSRAEGMRIPAPLGRSQPHTLNRGYIPFMRLTVRDMEQQMFIGSLDTNPASAGFLHRLASEAEQLKGQLRQIGTHVWQNKERVPGCRIQDLATRCNVHPSAIVRFAQRFGFSGFKELQDAIRSELTQRPIHVCSYDARIRALLAATEGGPLSCADIAGEIFQSSISGLQELQRDLHSSSLEDAVETLRGADAIWLTGSRRSVAITSYLAYALQHTDKRVQMLWGLGSMHEEQLRGVRPGDAMVAVCFSPYPEETLNDAYVALERGAHLVAITDDPDSPVTREAHASLVFSESKALGFRSLTNAMCVVQALFITLAYRLGTARDSTALPPASGSRAPDSRDSNAHTRRPRLSPH